MGFTKDWREVLEDKGYEWSTTEKELVNELMEDLGRYRVKKITEEEWNVNEGERFEFTISHKKKKHP